jgi:catechol 2,3-dioxygenase-like lactoylglutathione lyase family enzyme
VIRGINHVTFAVRDLERSFAFYRDVLGFRPRARWPQGAYFSAGALWFCIVVDDHARTEPLKEYTHLAFAVARSEFVALSEQIRGSGCEIWKANSSEGDSLYFLDPDGHKLEIHATRLEDRLRSVRDDPWDGLEIFE